MLNIIVFIVGWCLFVAAQCKNSLNSKTNGLVGWPGVKAWFLSQSVNLATRAFFSALGYGFLVHTVAAKIDSVGFHLTSTTISGFAGYGANGMLYQLFGLVPFLRVEVADLAPPANAQIVGSIAVAGTMTTNVAMASGSYTTKDPATSLPKPPGTP